MSFFFNLIILNLWGSTEIVKHASHLDCPNLFSTSQILECAIKVDPEVQRAQADVQIAKAELTLAGQRINPSLELSSSVGDKLGDRTSDFSGQFLHTFELGDKRSKRMSAAEAKLKAAETRFKQAQESVVIPIIMSLNRIRQIETEKKILESSLDHWDEIRKGLRSRLALTPEQRTSLTVFDLASVDAEFGISQLRAEEIDHRQKLEMSLRQFLKLSPSMLPPLKTLWPDILMEVNEIRSSTYLLTQVEKEIAKKEFEVQESLKWPDLSIGPTLSYQREGALGDTKLGFKVALPLPIYHRNRGGRELAAAAETKATLTSELTLESLLIKRRREVSQYRRAVEVLKKMGGFEKIEKEYKRVETLFRRGVLAAPLVIEAHRQMIDSTRSLNRQELMALESLWTIFQLDGRVLEEAL
jgi:cobalt-zinc-cadmium efflux system outer membrane protein